MPPHLWFVTSIRFENFTIACIKQSSLIREIATALVKEWTISWQIIFLLYGEKCVSPRTRRRGGITFKKIGTNYKFVAQFCPLNDELATPLNRYTLTNMLREMCAAMTTRDINHIMTVPCILWIGLNTKKMIDCIFWISDNGGVGAI